MILVIISRINAGRKAYQIKVPGQLGRRPLPGQGSLPGTSRPHPKIKVPGKLGRRPLAPFGSKRILTTETRRVLAQKEFWRPKPGEFWLKKNFGDRNPASFGSKKNFDGRKALLFAPKRILTAERRQGAPAKFDRVPKQTSPASVDWRPKGAKGRRPSLTRYQNKLPPPRLIGGRKAPRGAGQV